MDTKFEHSVYEFQLIYINIIKTSLFFYSHYSEVMDAKFEHPVYVFLDKCFYLRKKLLCVDVIPIKGLAIYFVRKINNL